MEKTFLLTFDLEEFDRIQGERRFELSHEGAEKVIEITGSRSRLVYKPLPADDPKQRQPDIYLAQKHLNWNPTVKLNDGLRKTIDYFDSILSAS